LGVGWLLLGDGSGGERQQQSQNWDSSHSTGFGSSKTHEWGHGFRRKHAAYGCKGCEFTHGKKRTVRSDRADVGRSGAAPVQRRWRMLKSGWGCV
jgi:hypothetical protein